MDRNLTKKQLARQDFVDNKIFELMQGLAPNGKKSEWNIDAIGSVREVVRKYLVNEKKFISDVKFYPFLKI